ncbi:MAG: hypothetical protein MUQ56_11760 [Thermoleophilia bacterium]|nr:hypothetical protein [Thermoleophilia bacterium]
MLEQEDGSLLTGDQCALCDAPLEGGPITLQAEDGSLLVVCSACAATSLPQPARSFSDAAEARGAVLAALERQRADHRLLDEVVELLRELEDEVAHWHTAALEAEKQAHTLEAELARTRERLRKSDDLLSTSSDAASALPADGMGAVEAGSTAPPAAARRGGHARELPAPAPEGNESTLTLDEVRVSQRHFNESPFVEKMGSVRRGLGRPAVSLLKVSGEGGKALLTVAWEIVWYQYVLDLDETCAVDERAELFTEGMELVELSDRFKLSNAELDDQGQLDASELEVALLHDESELLTHFSPEQDAALDDATEEIWDRHTTPEFRWDD